jgi:beta-lactamase class A
LLTYDAEIALFYRPTGAVSVKPVARALMLGAAICCLSLPAIAQKTTPSLGVERALIAQRTSQLSGAVSFAAIHVESGLVLEADGDMKLPLASVVKLPIAAYALSLVEAGRLSLDQRVLATREDGVPGGPLNRQLRRSAQVQTLEDLLFLMMTRSDNTATDLVLRLVGGPEMVQVWLSSKGFAQLRIDRSIRDMLADYYEVRGRMEAMVSLSDTLEDLPLAAQRDINARAGQPRSHFDADPRDQASALSLSRFLADAAAGKLMGREATDLLVTIMNQCATGARRIRGDLPMWITVGNKTGTLGGTVNDVALIDLPEGRGRIALSVLVGHSPAPVRQREKLIADLARLAVDWFTQRLPADPSAPLAPVVYRPQPLLTGGAAPTNAIGR